MSYPTALAPWYVVQRFRSDGSVSGDYLPPEYQTSDGTWTREEKQSMIFMSLQAAYRIAQAVAGHVRVLVDKDDLSDFRPKGEL